MTHVRPWELANRRLSAGKHSIEHPLQLVALPKSRLWTIIPADVWVETSVKNHKFRVLRCFWLFVHLPLNAASLHWETHKRNVFTCFQTMCQIHIIGTTPLKSPEPLIISTWSSVFWGSVQIHPIRSYWWSTTGRIHFNESIPQWTSTCSSKINDTWGIADDYIWLLDVSQFPLGYTSVIGHRLCLQMISREMARSAASSVSSAAPPFFK